MDGEHPERWARLTDSAQKLAGAFEKRRLDRSNLGELIKENIADLTAAGIIASDGPAGPFATPAEAVELLRIIAGGCGSTAFAMAAALTGEHQRVSRQRLGHILDAAVFVGLAERAFHLAVQRTKERSNTATADPALLPGTQFAIARIRGHVATMTALLNRHAAALAGPGDDRADGVAESYIPRYFAAAVTEQVVSAAFEIIGGSDPEYGQRIGWIWQDAKTGPVLPFSSDLALEVIGKAALGIDPDEKPRWL